jgi:hypothetical protein
MAKLINNKFECFYRDSNTVCRKTLRDCISYEPFPIHCPLKDGVPVEKNARELLQVVDQAISDLGPSYLKGDGGLL